MKKKIIPEKISEQTRIYLLNKKLEEGERGKMIKNFDPEKFLKKLRENFNG